MLLDERFYDVALTFLQGIGVVYAKKLVSYFGSSKKLFEASYSDIRQIPFINENIALRMYDSFESVLARARDEELYVSSNDIDLVTFTQDDYPARLAECVDAPLVLYYKGSPDFAAKKIVAIVGTRNATRYGEDFCNKLISQFSEKYPDVVIVSGLAFGIDVAAHKAALENNIVTWGVLGHSLETIYPTKHTRIANNMVEAGGAIITDYCHGSTIEPFNFAKRNRIVAGLCDAIVVVESAEKGGSIITADLANNYNKDVFAVPGNVNSSASKGCNKLIKTNRANLCEDLSDIEYIMNWKPKTKTKNLKIKFPVELSANEQKIVDLLKQFEFLDIDSLNRKLELEPNEISLALLQLEMKDVINSLPGKIYALK